MLRIDVDILYVASKSVLAHLVWNIKISILINYNRIFVLSMDTQMILFKASFNFFLKSYFFFLKSDYNLVSLENVWTPSS